MNISRRDFLRKTLLGAYGVTVWGSLPSLMPTQAWASSGNGTKVLFVNMSGGWDGLHVLQPMSGAVYSTLSTLRPTLIQNPSSLLEVGSNYGLNGNLTTMKTLYDEGKLLAVMNVGYNNMSRSHQDAEVAYARGVSDRLTPSSSGFINRVGASYGWNSLQAVSVAGADRSFDGGDYRGVQANGLSQYRFTGDSTQSSQENNFRRDTMYGVATQWGIDTSKTKQKEVVDGVGLVTNTTDTLRTALNNATFPTAYPSTQFGRQFRDIDVLFSTPSLGTEIGYMRRGGFDTHSLQSSGLNPILIELNAALGVFVSNMKAKGIWDNLIIVVLSEFGRTNRENGSQGTDHGGAIPLFLMGGPVAGGLLGSITTSDLTNNGWLPMQYNIIEIYRKVIAKMNYDPDQVFEASSGPSVGTIFT